MNGNPCETWGSCLVDLLQGPLGEAKRPRVVVHAREASSPLVFAHRLPAFFEGPLSAASWSNSFIPLASEARRRWSCLKAD